MKFVYEQTGGDQLRMLDKWEVAEKLGLEEEMMRIEFQYLRGEELLELQTIQGEFTITHLGVLEVEEAMTRPAETDHFPLKVVQNVFHGPIAAVHGGVGDQVIGNLEATIGIVRQQGDGELADAISALASAINRADDIKGP